jgi:hypothetical protein
MSRDEPRADGAAMETQTFELTHPDLTPYLVVGIVLLVCAIGSAVLAASKGTSVPLAFVLGLILGPIGLVVVLIQKPENKIDAVPWAQSQAPSRCPAVDSAGWQCVLPAGHTQPHSTR